MTTPATDESLNAAQRAVVFHGLETEADALLQGAPGAPPTHGLARSSPVAVAMAPPPLLVIAGAGSGKTLTLASRVARLLLQGADPQRLLLMSFSRRAAAALAQRTGHILAQMLSARSASGHGPPPQLPWCGTFHSVAARLLRQQASRIGLPNDFDIIDRSDAEELMAQTRLVLGLHRNHERFPLAATCLAMHSRCINSEQPLKHLLAEHWPWCDSHHDSLLLLFRAYAVEKQRQHLLDHDDLLAYWRLMFEQPDLAAAQQQRFDHVLVDEYQDTNPLQAAIVLGLKPQGRGLVVVGDDAQAIYSFRGASVRGILEFPQAFEPPARCLMLEQNYRSTPQILAAANALMAEASRGYAKRLFSLRPASLKPRLVTVRDEAAQARWVADEVLRQRERNLPLKRQAVWDPLESTCRHASLSIL